MNGGEMRGVKRWGGQETSICDLKQSKICFLTIPIVLVSIYNFRLASIDIFLQYQAKSFSLRSVFASMLIKGKYSFPSPIILSPRLWQTRKIDWMGFFYASNYMFFISFPCHLTQKKHKQNEVKFGVVLNMMRNVLEKW